MPSGDPTGWDDEYREKGKITRVWISAVPVSNIDSALEFYNEILGLPVQLNSKENNWIELGPPEPHCKIALYVPSVHDKRQPGGSTDIVFDTDSIYEFHRRLVDGGVKFKLKPQRQQWGGLMAVFLDPDGNEFWVVEDPEHYTRTNPTPR